MTQLPTEERFLDPQFGRKYIGYPAISLVVLGMVMLPVSEQSALGVFMMAIGYVVVGIGFLTTLLYRRRF